MSRRRFTLRLPGGASWTLGERTLVMGIVNVTPDSFSDGGAHLDVKAAVAAALRMVDDGADILDAIDRAGDAVRIVTLAPELAGSEDLVRHLVAGGRRVSLGHSGATLEQGRAAIEAGARQATHLYNRMPSLGHRDPGLVGAVLENDAVAAEIICDGVHVHPAIVRMSVSLKHPERVMAITDATAAAGLATGSHAQLGGRRITVAKSAAYLDDGTLAGSIATMDRVFRFLVMDVGLSPVAAARLCSTTPADELGLQGFGRIARGAIADLVVLDRNFTVKHVFIAGKPAYSTGDAETPSR
jgi:N-acetylglucosamine-6-phosphate deacetylase